MNTSASVSKMLLKLGNRERAKISQRFFKTGPGEYGQGDIFIGLTVPQLRKLAREYKDLPLQEITKLLQSPVHEIRFLAIVMLMNLYKKADDKLQERIYKTYLRSIKKYINNWDLIDVSAPHIVGAHLEQRPKDILYTLARSTSLWERRVAMLATFRFIRNGSAELGLEIAEMLVHDKHDLIQKAVGWMLREIGNYCSPKIEEQFLERHASTMPRTMLRYAIEKFPPVKRSYFLNK